MKRELLKLPFFITYLVRNVEKIATLIIQQFLNLIYYLLGRRDHGLFQCAV